MEMHQFRDFLKVARGEDFLRLEQWCIVAQLSSCQLIKRLEEHSGHFIGPFGTLNSRSLQLASDE